MSKKHLYLHYGARRSGNHGFVYWLTDQLQNTKWINNYHTQDHNLIIKNDKIQSNENYSDSGKNSNLGTANFNHIIYSFENIIPNLIFINNLKKHYLVHVTVIIRDPENHLTSLIKNYQPTRPHKLQQALLKSQQLTQFILDHITSHTNIIWFKYENWMTDLNSRQQILQQLNIKPNDNKLLQRRGWGRSQFTPNETVQVNEMLTRHQLLKPTDKALLNQTHLDAFKTLFPNLHLK